MKATELMIGDWVLIDEPDKYAGAHCKILSLQAHEEEDNAYFNVFVLDEMGVLKKDVCSADIRPIPLTKDILIRNGFSSLTDEMFSACETETHSNQELKIYLSHIGCEYNPVQLVVYMGYEPQERVVLRMMPCQYVHELQHAFRMCGITKEIEL